MLELNPKHIHEDNKPPEELIGQIKELYFQSKGGKLSTPEIDKELKKAANKFIPYSTKILEIGEIIQVNKTEKLPDMTDFGKTYFKHVEEETSREFLGDILKSRKPEFPNFEAGKMLREMGIKIGACNKPLQEVTTERVIRSVLQGKLQFKPTPQPK